MTWLFVAILVALLLLSVPLFVLIGIATAVGFLFFDASIDTLLRAPLIESVRELTDKEPLLAIPFFVLSGAIMSNGAIAQRLVNVARQSFAPIPGGLGIATVAACMFFAAISGSSPVTVITIGGIMYPALVKAGFTERFATGLVTSAGTLGILIPPSIPMIVYAIFASNSGQVIKVEDFFLAGIGPGIVIGLLLGVFCLVVGLRKGERFSRPDYRALGESVIEGFWSLMLPVLILGGIYSGLFNATEAAAVSVVYALGVELYIHRSLHLKQVPAVFAEATVLMGSLLVIFAMAVGLNALLTELQIPDKAAAWITSLDLTPFTFLLILNGFLLVVGCLMDIISAIMILVPLLAPLALVCGIDPIHLGIVFIVNLELGYLTPPMGLNLFVSSSLFEKPLGEVIKSVVPFTGLLLVAVLIVSYVPTIAMGPVNALNDRPFVMSFPTGDRCATPERTDDLGDPLDEEPPPKGTPKEDDGEGKSIGDMMQDDTFQDVWGDESDDEKVEKKDDGKPKSIGDMMDDDAFQDVWDEE